MIIKREVTEDEQIRSFIKYNGLVDNLCPDQIDIDDVSFIGGNMRYLGYFMDDELMSIVAFKPYKDGVMMHPMASKGHRKASREIIKDAINTANSNIYIEITTIDKKLENYAKKLGFKSFGNGKEFVKDGKITVNKLMRLEI